MSDAYKEALACAIQEYRNLKPEVAAKELRLRRVRAAIFTLSNKLGIAVPDDVMATIDKRTVTARKAMRICLSSPQEPR
jgi:hypothetical protein